MTGDPQAGSPLGVVVDATGCRARTGRRDDFYSRVFGFELADDVEPVQIENL